MRDWTPVTLPGLAATIWLATQEPCTVADLVTAAATFNPDTFTVVLVGDRAKIEKELKAKFPTRNIEWR